MMASPTSSSPTLSPVPDELKSRSPSRKRSQDDTEMTTEEREKAIESPGAEPDGGGENVSQQNRESAQSSRVSNPFEHRGHGTAELPIIQAADTAHLPPLLAKSSMPPPATPIPTAQPRTQKPPRSGQGSPSRQKSPSGTQKHQASTTPKPNGNVSSNRDTQNESHDESDNEDLGDVGNPQDQIDAFDWQDLEQRYHDNMAQLKRNEDGIVDEFNDLCQFFGVWASTTQTHEVNRSFKRLKTQMTFVQREESELEEKRKHYIKVVGAFQHALHMLTQD